MTKKEKLLIDGCKILNIRLEVTLIVMACCRSDKQQGVMLDWMKKHYQEKPTEEEVLEIAETIREEVQ